MKLISEQWSDDVNYLVEEDPKTGKKQKWSYIPKRGNAERS